MHSALPMSFIDNQGAPLDPSEDGDILEDDFVGCDKQVELGNMLFSEFPCVSFRKKLIRVEEFLLHKELASICRTMIQDNIEIRCPRPRF